MASAKQVAQEHILENSVAIFSKSRCPFCIHTKALFKELGYSVAALELDQRSDGSAIQNALHAGVDKVDGITYTNTQRTVPSTWIGKEFIGGDSELTALYTNHKDKLLEMLEAAGAEKTDAS